MKSPHAGPASAGSPRVQRLLRPLSGWVLGLLTWIYAAATLRLAAHVELLTTATFSGYVVGMLVLPGTLIWRALRTVGRGARELPRRPLVEDLALGAVLGYALELPVYLLCRYLGHPVLTWAWPAAVVVVSLVTRSGRRLWTRSPNHGRAPVWWSLVMTALIVFITLRIARYAWLASPADSISALQNLYVDEPFHLSVVGDLKHHFPAQFPFVAGTPLYYHWLTYAHVASSSWATGLEPALLLRILTFPTIIGLTILAAAMMTVRLTGRWWPGLIPAFGLGVMSTPGLFSAWLRVPLTAPFAQSYGSPTQVFVTLLVTLDLLLILELIRSRLQGVRWWVLAAFIAVVVAGSKSTFPPVLIAGLMFTVAFALVFERRLNRAALWLVLLNAAVLLLAQRVFYGSGARALTIDPLSYVRSALVGAHGLHEADQVVPLFVTALVTVVYLSALAVFAAGALGFRSEGGWRDPAFTFLTGTCLAGIAGWLILGHYSLSQYYFLQAARLPVLVLSALGFARLVSLARANPASNARLGVGPLLAVAAVTSVGLATFFIPWLTPRHPTPPGRSVFDEAVSALGIPLAEFWAAVLLAGLMLNLVARAARLGKFHRRLTTAVLLFALAGTLPLSMTRTLLADPIAPTSDRAVLPDGGVAAARWVRDHTSTDDLVATNSHCGEVPPRCVSYRSFWVAGFTERRVLVEGWAYIDPTTVGQAPGPDADSNAKKFWDPARLTANNAAFHQPSPQTVSVLRDRYHVRWLVVDLRDAKVPVLALAAAADLEFRKGQTAVFQVR